MHFYRFLVKLDKIGWGEEISIMGSYERASICYTLLKEDEVGTG